MPIDLAAVAAAFAQLRFQDRLANTAGRAIQVALEKRAEAARAAELRGRDLPILRFVGDALAVWVVTPAGDAETLPDRVLTLGASAWRPASAGWDRWWHAGTDLSALLSAAEQLLAPADEAITRYATPTPGLFDPRNSTMFDLVGVVSAFFETMRKANATGPELDPRIKEIVAAAAPFLPAAKPSGPLDRGAAAPAVSGLAAERYDAAALSGLAVLVAIPQLLKLALEAVDIRIRLVALDALQRVERQVRGGVAAAYLWVFTTVRALTARSLRLVQALQVVAGAFVASITKFAVGFGTGIAVAIRDFVFVLARFLRAVAIYVSIIVDLLEILGLDAWTHEKKAPRTWVTTDFPDFGQTLFGEDVRRKVGAIVKETDEGIRESLRTGLTKVGDQLEQTSKTFLQLADREPASRLSSRLPEDATSIAAQLFLHEPAPTKRDPLAEAMGSWTASDRAWSRESLAAGGAVGVVVAVLDGYAREMADEWRARLVDGSTGGTDEHRPTSPHILRRNVRAPRVEVPRVLVRVGGPPDADVLDQVADELASAVVDAYRQGTRRLQVTGAGR